jgi:diguanylate cyclase (GGDEF)-like protein/PAS domain S-box-containing protein
MGQIDHLGNASSTLARRALFVGLSLALASAGFGVLSIRVGMVIGAETALVIGSCLLSAGALLTLLLFRRVGIQTIATVTTIFLTVNIVAGMLIAVTGPKNHINLFIYLFWLFPLLVFNKLVNQPSVGRWLARILQVTPILLMVCLLPRLEMIFDVEQRVVVGVFCIAYCCYGLTLNIVTRYRERYIVELERMASLKRSAEVLESISDCFISVDPAMRLTYLNDAACTEFGVGAEAGLNADLFEVTSGFFSESMMQGLRDASTRSEATLFEAQNEARGQWYDMRCFPGPAGMSIYFRNVTRRVLTRLKLDEAYVSLLQQAELLDKAQDAIVVVDMNFRFTYWNKGAERLYGWREEEVLGQLPSEVFQYDPGETKVRSAALLKDGEWSGEAKQCRKDGRSLIVESRRTIVKDDKGVPRAILSINTDITARKASEARIDYLAFYDVLTELPNRQLLRLRLSEALETSTARNAFGALLYIDLDDFKTLNDTMGHDTGDALLCQVAERLRRSVPPEHMVARLGGDEFVVMLEGLGEDSETAAAIAKTIGDQILELFVEPFSLGSYRSDTQASIGATLFGGIPETVDDLMKQSDLAMYAAKAAGRNAMCFFNPAMQAEVEQRASLRADLRRALSENEFELHYQPQVDDAAGVTGAEALLRWHHPLRGSVAPMEFIPLAEEAGLIVELGRWVLETACMQIAAWAKIPALEHLTVSVNVSLRQFLDPHFVHRVEEALRTSGANPQRLKLEITESSVMAKVEEIIFKMTKIRSLGVAFSLDDFGTGYSSLSHLRYLPLQQLKIDRSFVRDVLTDAKDASIVRTIILLGRSLNLAVIAEGVETAPQRDFLMRKGCHLFQGFLYGPALPSRKFEAFVATSAEAMEKANSPASVLAA